MTRDRIKKLLPIITAFAEGKTIEVKDTNNKWGEITDPYFDGDPEAYRIKQESKYHPFESAEECWKEMQKHQPFGWIKFRKKQDGYIHFEVISDYGISFNPDTTFTFEEMFERYTFLDGDLFGTKS